MIEFYRLLWPILNRTTRIKLLVASALMAVIAMLEGFGLLALVPLLQLLTSPNFSAQSSLITQFSDVLGRSGESLAAALGVIAFCAYMLKGFGAIFVLRWAATFAMEQEYQLVKRMLTLYLGAPLSVHFAINSAEFQRTLNQSLRSIFSNAFVSAFSCAGDLMGVILVSGILLVTSPGLTLIGLAYFAIMIGIYQRVVNQSVRKASAHIHRDQAAVYRDVQQSLAAIKELKAGAVEEHFIERISRSRRAMLHSYRTIALTSVQPRYVFELAMVGAAAVAAVFVYSTQTPAAATASIAIFLAGGFRILAPLTKVFNGVNQVRVAKPSLVQIGDDLRDLTEPSGEQLRESETPHPIEPTIEVRELSYSYDGTRRVLRDVDLDVRPGEAVALIGSSGAGKSTMVDLLLGLLQPTYGTIRVGGHELNDVRRSWQRSVAYVPQHVSLLDASVRDNVMFGSDCGDDDEIWRALDQAQLRGTVERLPEGLDTRIGERGVRLSGGQRQRLGIARALYRRPSLLVLDEATSALDNQTEAQFTDVLRGLRGRVTTIAIAHRLSTVRDVDRVYFFSNGRVVDAGTFDELTQRVPDFAQLVDLSTVGGEARLSA